MSIASEITRVQGAIADAYDAAEAKGATMPTTENVAALADCIESIPSGGGADLSVYTYANGTHPQSIDELLLNMTALERWESDAEAIGYIGTSNRSFAYYSQSRFSIKYIKLNSVTSVPARAFWDNGTIIELHLPSLSGNRGYYYNCLLTNSANLRVLDIGGLYCNNGNADYLILGTNLDNLIDIRQRKTVAVSDYLFRRVRMQNAISTSLATLLTDEDIAAGFTSNNQKWNWNLREHLIAYLPQTSDKYYYFYQSVIDAMEQATLDAFAAKGWGVAAVN